MRSDARSGLRSRKMSASGASNDFFTGRNASLHWPKYTGFSSTRLLTTRGLHFAHFSLSGSYFASAAAARSRSGSLPFSGFRATAHSFSSKSSLCAARASRITGTSCGSASSSRS